jgi:alkylation response protein AidB-like acyl-CoA dehydrogenase
VGVDLAESDEQQFLREAVRGVVEREAPLGAVRAWVLEDRVDHAAAAAMAVRQGWTGIGLPEDLGGQGGGTLELAILAEELGRGAVPADRLYAALLAALLLARADAPSGSGLVQAIAEGESSAALLLDARGPLDAPGTVEADQMVLGAHGAELLIGLDASGLWLADAEKTHTRPLLMVDRTRALADLTGVVAGGRRLGAVAAEAVREVAATAAVIVAADALGASQRMLDMTVEYVVQRTQFGVPVGSFQAVKHAASEMLVAIEGTRAVVQYAAWALSAQQPGNATDAWVAKARSARAAELVADRALFLHGAVGYTWEHDLQLLFKRAKSDAQLFGGPGCYEERIADSLELLPG